MKSIRKPGREVLDLLAGCSPGVTRLALELRGLVLMEAPQAEEVLYAVYAQVIVFRCPGRKRGAFCNVAAYERHVNLVFYYGASLPDPQGLLKGTGKQMRHLRFEPAGELRRSEVRGYIRSAIELARPVSGASAISSCLSRD